MSDNTQPVNFDFNYGKTAEDWAVIVLDKWFNALNTYHIGVTGALQRSFTKELLKANGNVDQVIFKFLKYGRFDDMGLHIQARAQAQDRSRVRGNVGLE